MQKFGLLFIGIAVLLFTQCGVNHSKNTTEITDEVTLGKALFFDPILSADKSLSCASCHKPQFAFADNVPLSKGINGALTARNTPSAMNVAGRPYLFWDGRSPTLEDQVLHPIANPAEMGFNVEKLVGRLAENAQYVKYFNQVYGKNPSAELLGKAIAAYERSLETADTPFDKFMLGDSTAISKAAKRGREIFLGKGNCFDCHFSPDFTGDEFKNIGIFNGKQFNDSGRFKVSNNAGDIGSFKVPGLRNIGLTAPYMHNGMFKNLKEVIEYYNLPSAFISDAIGTDKLIKPLNLTEQEKEDLLAFLNSLTAKIE